MPIGSRSRDRLRVEPEGVGGREPALLHRRRREAREADHVADRVDVLDRRAVVLVDARCGRASRPRCPAALEAELGGRALPPGRVEDRVGGDPLAALRACVSVAAVVLVDADVTFSPSRNDDAQVAQVVLQRLDDLGRRRSSSSRVALLDDGHPRCRARRTSRRTRCRSRRRRRRRAARGCAPGAGCRPSRARWRSSNVDARRDGPAWCRSRSRSARPSTVAAPCRSRDLDRVRVGEATLPGQDADVVSRRAGRGSRRLSRCDHLAGCARCRSSIVISSLTR